MTYCQWGCYLRDKANQTSDGTKYTETEADYFIVDPWPYMSRAYQAICHFIVFIYMFLSKNRHHIMIQFKFLEQKLIHAFFSVTKVNRYY